MSGSFEVAASEYHDNRIERLEKRIKELEQKIDPKPSVKHKSAKLTEESKQIMLKQMMPGIVSYLYKDLICEQFEKAEKLALDESNFIQLNGRELLELFVHLPDVDRELVLHFEKSTFIFDSAMEEK